MKEIFMNSPLVFVIVNLAYGSEFHPIPTGKMIEESCQALIGVNVNLKYVLSSHTLRISVEA